MNTRLVIYCNPLIQGFVFECFNLGKRYTILVPQGMVAFIYENCVVKQGHIAENS
jgi:hypothetical protein